MCSKCHQHQEMMAQQMAGVSELAAKPKYQLPLENKYRGQRELFQRGMQFFNNGEIKEAINLALRRQEYLESVERAERERKGRPAGQGSPCRSPKGV